MAMHLIWLYYNRFALYIQPMLAMVIPHMLTVIQYIQILRQPYIGIA